MPLIRSFIRAITSQSSDVHVPVDSVDSAELVHAAGYGERRRYSHSQQLRYHGMRFTCPKRRIGGKRYLPVFYSYGNAYTSTLVDVVSRASCSENAIGFSHLFTDIRVCLASVATCTGRYLSIVSIRALRHCHQYQSNRLVHPLDVQTTLNSFARIHVYMCVTTIWRNYLIHLIYLHFTIHTHTIIADQCSGATVIICVYTSSYTVHLPLNIYT